MSYVVITTKPSYALLILPSLMKRYPGRRILGVLDGAVSLLDFRYPRGLSMADYPYVSAPHWRPNPERMKHDVSYEITDGRRVTLDADPFELLRGAERIVCADGEWWGGAANLDVLLRHAGGADLAERPHDFLRSSSLRADAIASHVANMGSTHDADFMAYRDGGLVKRRFDWCFAVNAQALLGAAHRQATGTDQAPTISKYGLQLLYAMRNQEPMTEGQLITLLAHWSGTGRYVQETKPTIQMGSAMSFARIVEDVTKSGLTTTVRVMRKDRETDAFTLGDAGRRFIDALHPDCHDPDLPWRVQSWMEEGKQSQDKADRYVRTFFGKQKRFATRSQTDSAMKSNPSVENQNG